MLPVGREGPYMMISSSALEDLQPRGRLHEVCCVNLAIWRFRRPLPYKPATEEPKAY